MSEKIKPGHLQRRAMLYVRQSSQHQVLHNEESRRLQYAMKQRLQTLGWAEVEVVDEDLGQSASGSTDRSGFQRMVAEVCFGKIGAVAAREVSRFARNSRDWHQLIEMCSLVDTLLVDQETIYDPRQSNDRLLLGLKGSLNEYELDLLRQRSLDARKAKAARGELLIMAPVGYLKTPDQRFEKDPDKRVRKAIGLVFVKFLELGSARQTLMWFLDRGLELPARIMGTLGWETVWKRPSYATVIHILQNPVYAGAYVYGKTTPRVEMRDGQMCKVLVHKPMDEWSVLIPDHHEGYIPWEKFKRIKKMMVDNISNSTFSSRGAPKRGPALLNGLLRCCRCGRTLMTQYTGTYCKVPRYSCHRGHVDSGEPKCISFGGVPVDEAVSHAVTHVVQPCAIEAAVAAVNEETHRKDSLLDILLLELKAARYAAERAWKQYDAADPANRLVADELEQRWESALKRAQELDEKIEKEQGRQQNQVQFDVDSLVGLASDLDTVWNAPETDVRLKKRIIRTLIEEIIVDVDTDANEVVLVIHWKGGVHTELRVPRRRRGYHSGQTSKDVVESVRQLALICTDDVIASFLNRNGLRTGIDNRFTKQRVASLRSKHGIKRHMLAEKGHKEWMNQTEAAAYAGVNPKTLRRAVDRGDVQAIHPLPDGPWVFKREWLDSPKAYGVFEQAKAGNRSPIIPNSEQLKLDISST